MSAGRVLAALAGSLMAAGQGWAEAPEGHNQFFDKHRFHPPAADQECAACHSLHAPGAPRYLKAALPKLCYQCHKDVTGKDTVHEPAGRGACTDCHQMHTSDQLALLHRKVPDLCLECHTPDEAHKSRGTVCSGCHVPHSSDTAKLLEGKEAKACKDCHGDKWSGKDVHPPAREGRCLSCHFTHRDPRLKATRLRLPHPSGGGGPYPLCESCHPMALYRNAAYQGTGFRTARENLHARHSSGPRGLACSACHEAHTARQAALMEDWVRLPGKEAKPMQYLRFKGGGSCGPACHGSATYVRDGRSEVSEAGE